MSFKQYIKQNAGYLALKWGRRMLVLGLAGVAVLYFLQSMFVINVTQSLPRGIYLKNDAPPQKGDLVLLCLPPNDMTREAAARGYIGYGKCPGGYGYLLKQIWAVSGDIVQVDKAGVWINGELRPNSQSFERDAAGRPIPGLLGREFILGPDEFFCASDYNVKSFDGRYFGPLGRQNIICTLTPFYLWEAFRAEDLDERATPIY